MCELFYFYVISVKFNRLSPYFCRGDRIAIKICLSDSRLSLNDRNVEKIVCKK